MTRRSLVAPTAVVLDYDLTLVDSRRGFIAAHRHAAEQMGIPPPAAEAVERAIGTPLDIVVPRMFPEMAPPDIVEYIRLYRHQADEVMTSLTTVLPGAAEAISALHEAGMRLAIVSQKLRSLVEPVLQREGLHVDVVLGGEDVPAFKPDPAGLHLALQRLGAAADDALYVGDTTIDAEAAANAGLRFIGVLSGVTPREDFGPYEVLALLGSISDLPPYLGV